MTWIRRNALAFAILIVALGVFTAFVAYPQWRMHLGEQVHITEVAAGETIRLGDVDWQVKAARPEQLEIRLSQSSSSLKIAAFIYERTKDDRPITPEEAKGWHCFNDSAIDSHGRSWGRQEYRLQRARITGTPPKIYTALEGSVGYTETQYSMKLVPAEAVITGVKVTCREGDSGPNRFILFRV